MKWISKNVSDIAKFKSSIMAEWVARADYYHNNWVIKKVGPFKATTELVNSLMIQPDDHILDVACGTGAVAYELSHCVSDSGNGLIVGIDLSEAALRIANSYTASVNKCFIEMDPDNIGIRCNFDKVACQFALNFFPEPQRMLRQVWEIMKPNARLGIVVHGTPEGVPYYNTIAKPLSKYLPYAISKGLYSIHRFGNPKDLTNVLVKAGFSEISVSRYTYEYKLHSFEEYWSTFFLNGYESSLAPILFSRRKENISKIKSEAEVLSSQYMKNDKIVFPWEVLIAISSRT